MPSPAEQLAFAERASGLAGIGLGWADGCLVEGPDGRLVAHRLADVESLPHPLVRAVLSGDLSTLEGALGRRRALGLVSAGPVLSASVEGRFLVRVPLREGAGAVWLLVVEPPSLVELEDVSDRATRLLHATSEVPQLLWCLEGHEHAEVPPALAERPRLWVVALVGSPEPLVQLARAGGLAIETCLRDLTWYAVVGGAGRTVTSHVQAHVQTVVRQGSPGSRAGLSAPTSADGLATARAHGIDPGITVETAYARAPTTMHKSSMLQDFEANRPPEIDGLLTAVQAFARAAGIPTPHLDTATALVIEKARKLGLYPPSV